MSSDRSPFVKWAGGKRRLVPFIAGRLSLAQGDDSSVGSPDGSCGRLEEAAARWPRKRLVEPFAGGAAFSLAMADQFESIWLNDVNADLINVYVQLRSEPAKYIRDAATLFTPEMNTAEAYYRLRERFNTTTSSWEKAVVFLYLNRHGYNGLCRYNASGLFNVPYGRYKRPYFPEEELRAAAVVLQKAELTCLDFEEVLAGCGPGDVVYCDPPYVPLSPTASFTDYAAGGFDMADQRRLVRAAEQARRRGALVAISNHDNQVTRELYRHADCHYVHVRRTISCDGNNRNEAAEVLAIFWPSGAEALETSA